MIRVYNSLTRKKDEFSPLNPPEVKMYACGITPYDDAHIGHAMQAVIFDTIRRYLEYSGYKVTYVRNFTDVDDKIINRANKEGLPPELIAKKYMDSSREELKRLKVKPASHEPLVSENIKEIIDFVKGLIDKGYAYESNGSVYFEVAKFTGYGKLSGRSIEELSAEGGAVEDETVSSEKRAPYDFALWKNHKEGEPFWDSPWGKGRPGWHIECSAMAKTYLGESIDIHGGGVDIIFPHHENEVTQSEALTGKPFAKYWLHNGLVMVGKQKMSKSLGNFYTINDALKKYSPDVIRYMILSFSFNSNCNFDETNLMNSEKRLYYYYYTLRKLNYLYDKCEANEALAEMTKVFVDFKKKFQDSMDDNFNSAEALASLNEVFAAVNQYMDKNKKWSSKVFDEFREAIKPVQDIFSILDEDPVLFMEAYKDRVCCRNSLNRKYIEQKIEERCDARKNKDFKKADDIRTELMEKCIVIMDGPEGTDWCSN